MTESPTKRGRGRPPSPEVAALRSRVAALVQSDPNVTPARIAAELEIPSYRAQQLLTELRRIGLAPAPVAVAADGRKLAREIRGRRPRPEIAQDVLDRLRAAAGGEPDVEKALVKLLDELVQRRTGWTSA